jgi:hypothetical protein
MVNNPVIIRDPILRYIFLSIFALLLLTACGGSDTDTSSNDSINVFENTTGAKLAIDKESTTDGKTRQKTEDVVKLDTGPINNEVGPITTEVGNDLDKLKKTNVCVECDLSGANLTEANLYQANLTGANLNLAYLGGAILDGVKKAGFTGAYNVPEQYIKD